MDYLIKVNTQMIFDSIKEKHIIKKINDLRENHKLTKFIANSLRLTIQHPELFEQHGINVEKNEIDNKSQEEFNSIHRELCCLRRKIDIVQEIAIKNRGLAKAHKFLGFEEKSEQVLRAAFMIEMQARRLERALEIPLTEHTFYIDKLSKTDELLEEILEEIIETYDGVVGELKESLVEETKETTRQETTRQELSKQDINKQDLIENLHTNEDEIVDFGLGDNSGVQFGSGGNLDLLAAFAGE